MSLLDAVPDDPNVRETLGLQLPDVLPQQLGTFHCPAAAGLVAPAPKSTPKTYAERLDDLTRLNDSISYGINFDVMDSEGFFYHIARHTLPGSDTDHEQPRCSKRFPDPNASPPVSNTLTVADKKADRYFFTQIRNPSQFILVSEADTEEMRPHGVAREYPATGARISMEATGRQPPGTETDLPPHPARIVPRHSSCANVLFADMHVEAVEIGAVPDSSDVTKDINKNTPLWTLPAD